MVEQNLFLCLLFSSLAGIFTIAGKVVVLQLARRRRQQQQHQLQQNASGVSSHHLMGPKPLSLTPSLPDASGTKEESTSIQPNQKEKRKKLETYCMLTAFVVAQIIANSFIFISPWFGPVSIYWPAYIASQLLGNMLIVGTCLQQESFDKPAQIATMVVVAAVLYITITGPGESQEQQDIRTLVSGNWFAIVWLGLLCLVFCLSFLVMMSFWIGNCRRHPRRRRKSSTIPGEKQKQERPEDPEESSQAGSTSSTGTGVVSPLVLETVLLLVSMTCSTLSATASKAASTLTASSNNNVNPQDASLRTGLIALTWIIIICWSLENYMEGRHVRSLGRFLPLMTLGSILLNAATGLIVWRDARVVTSWAGYVTALCLLGMGVYLISDLDFFQAQVEEQQDYQRQLETWHDLFGDLEEDLHRARVEQSLSRHQRTISRTWSQRGLSRANSDPELGTRSSHMSIDSHSSLALVNLAADWVANTTCTTTGSLSPPPPPPPKSSSSLASSISMAGPPKSASSLSSVEWLSSSPLPTRSAMRKQHCASSPSATVRTMDSLERIITSLRDFQEDPALRSITSITSTTTSTTTSIPRRGRLSRAHSMTLSPRWSATAATGRSTRTSVSMSPVPHRKKTTHHFSATPSSSDEIQSTSIRTSSTSPASVNGVNDNDNGFMIVRLDDAEGNPPGLLLPPPPPPPNRYSYRTSPSPRRSYSSLKNQQQQQHRRLSFSTNSSWDEFDLDHPCLEEESDEDEEDEKSKDIL